MAQPLRPLLIMLWVMTVSLLATGIVCAIAWVSTILTPLVVAVP